MECRLRENEIPIIVHVYRNQIWLHMRTVREEEVELLANGISQAVSLAEPTPARRKTADD